ncbi:GNAT family N-acetyltransferase [Aliiroseovarius crassostreae]|uniref:GNAT family N-acetyltransferase n=1 Tax=Aliiroseovarius crassostreae TaxID=154981 RepID=UPI0021FB5B5F|nr:GNAT family N-acetyltransferase [Aliiroseovarius crassostreae]UWP92394.1 GNAT family N-acetyltransferase [Aliiroseovarius crassostreae]
MTPRLASAEDAKWILELIQRVFAEHDGRIDPPSSMHRMGLADVERQIAEGEVWVINRAACLFLTPLPDALYLSKLAVTAKARGKGVARKLVEQAGIRAIALGKPCLRLKTRVELSQNHTAFRALGFDEVGASSHPGFDRPTSLSFEKRLIS